MAAYEVLLLNTAIPQIQAAQSGDTYVCPRDIAFSAALTLSAGTANGVPYLNASKVLTTGSALTFDGTNLFTVAAGTPKIRFSDSGLTADFGLDFYFPSVASSYGQVTLNGATGAMRFVAGKTGSTGYYQAFELNGSEQMRLTSTGLGIGTSNPGGKLEVNTGTVADATSIVLNNTSNAYPTGYNGSTSIYAKGYAYNSFSQENIGRIQFALDSAFDSGWGSSIRLYTSNSRGSITERARITSGGEWQVNGGATSVPSTSDSTLTFTGGGYATTNNIAAGVFGAIRGTVLVGGNYTGGTDTDVGNIKFLYGPRSTTSENTATIASISAFNTGTTSTSGGYLRFSTTPASGSVTERARITSVGNLKLGGTADRATTVGTNHFDIFNGTAPVGTLTDGISIYSSSGEAYVMDAAGNATLFSPHDAETNEWIFKSKHTPTGKVLKIDVERLLKFVNDHFGLDAVHEFVEE